MSEPRCPGCNHPEPLHTMECRWRNPLYPILHDLIDALRAIHEPRHLANGQTTCTHSLNDWPCQVALVVDLAEERLNGADYA